MKTMSEKHSTKMHIYSVKPNMKNIAFLLTHFINIINVLVFISNNSISTNLVVMAK